MRSWWTALLVCMFGVAACRRAPHAEPEPHAVAAASASGRVIAPESSPQRGDATTTTAPNDGGDGGDGGATDAAKGECADSNECSMAGAICCMTARELPPKDKTSPFSHFEYEHHAICTTTPEKDCDTLELCKGASCRRPKPAKVQLRCGGITCTDPTSRCVLDLNVEQRAPGQKARPPMCIGDDAKAKALAGDPWELSCLKTEDCPRGAHCSLAYFTFIGRIDTACVFKPLRPAHGKKTAPMCQDQSECAKLVDGYGPKSANAPSRCRPLRGAPNNVRACEVPGNEELF